VQTYKPEPDSFPGVTATPAPMAPLISSNFLATLEAADLRLLSPTSNSAFRAFKFCGLQIKCLNIPDYKNVKFKIKKLNKTKALPT